MKKLMIAALCLLTLAACKQNGNNAAELALQQQRDSLTRIIEQKDNEIDDMMATMNDIQGDSVPSTRLSSVSPLPLTVKASLRLRAFVKTCSLSRTRCSRTVSSSVS